MKRFQARNDVILIIKTNAEHDEMAQRLLQGGSFKRKVAGVSGILYIVRMSHDAVAEFLAIKPDELQLYSWNTVG